MNFTWTSTPATGRPSLARLARFKLRVKVDIEPVDWRCVALRGPGAAAAWSKSRPWGRERR